MASKIENDYNKMLAATLRGGNYESFNENPYQVLNAAQSMPTGYTPVAGVIPQDTYRGEIAFRVTRSSSNLNVPLPIPFGCAFAFMVTWADLIRSVLPSTVVLLSTTGGNNSFTFTYALASDNLVRDTVVIYGDSYPIFAFNWGLWTRKASMSVVRMTVPDVQAITNQMAATPMRPFNQTWLGNVMMDRNTISLSPGQYNKNVFDITAPTEISEEKGFLLYTLPDTGNTGTLYTYSIQMFMKAIVKI